jgi:hypothetical protein
MYYVCHKLITESIVISRDMLGNFYDDKLIVEMLCEEMWNDIFIWLKKLMVSESFYLH